MAAASAARNRPRETDADSDSGDSYLDNDEDDPFADHNEVGTPKHEHSEPRWS